MKTSSLVLFALVFLFPMVSCRSVRYANPCSEKLEQLDLVLENADDYVDAKEEYIG